MWAVLIHEQDSYIFEFVNTMTNLNIEKIHPWHLILRWFDLIFNMLYCKSHICSVPGESRVLDVSEVQLTIDYPKVTENYGIWGSGSVYVLWMSDGKWHKGPDSV